MPRQRAPTKQDPRDSRIERPREKLTRVERDRDRRKRGSEHLKKQLDAARRAGLRQAAAFAKDRPQGRGRRPAKINETHRAPASAACPNCGGKVMMIRVATQYQEALPVVRPIVRRFDSGVGHGLVVRMHTQLGVPLVRVAQLLRTQLGVSVTPGR